jgi:glycosyltransferase involved in cell wall biosynthesis
MAPVNSRLVMLGAAPEMPGSITSLVDAYRVHGLFKRWPIDYLATHADSGVLRNAALALSALRRFIEVLVHERGTVAHLHTEVTRGFWRDAVFMGLAIAARCPFILHLHGGGFQRFYDGAGRVRRAAIRFLLEHAAYIVVPCEALGIWIRGIARSAQVVCVPHPVAPVEVPQDTGRPGLVLFLARLDPAKGVFDLLEALSAVRAAVPDVRLMCAGDGDRAAVARYAEHLGIADMVKFTGWVGPSARRALLESAAVFALPSYDEEALPLGLLEAMAAGVPAVVSPVGGVPEVVVDGVSGFFAAPGDIATLQRLLRKLLLDRALGARVGAAARESVRLRCSPERALARLGELYAALGVRAWGESPGPVHDARAPKAALCRRPRPALP